ncbi:MAG TPA: hypothetical protein VE547_07950, partial [Mycobacteriales bacterium]|nr:hypothetical protein [Mycobacteriales bacterium]
MTADEGRWLRDRMAAAMVVEAPPADLADRAERTAVRIRRRRRGTAVAAAAVAVLAVAVPLLLAGAGPADRSLPPARPTNPACERSDRALPGQPAASGPADVAWPFRGDPALRPGMDRLAAEVWPR